MALTVAVVVPGGLKIAILCPAVKRFIAAAGNLAGYRSQSPALYR